MRRWSLLRKVAGLSKLLAYYSYRLASVPLRRMKRIRPADVALGPNELFRTDALLLTTLAATGTIFVPASRLNGLRRWLSLSDYLRVLGRCRPCVGTDTVALLDDGESAASHERRSVQIRHNYYSTDSGSQRLDCPYPLHPWFYMTGVSHRLTAMRGKRRRFRMVFAGAGNYHEVDRRAFAFPLLPRGDIVNHIRERFAHLTFVVTQHSELADLARTDRPIVLVLHDPGPTGRFPIPLMPQVDYVRLLAVAEFALCPPGLMMPHAHNLTEAMAVGTIPITNYAAWCRPQMISGEDCIGFSTIAELDAAVELALSASSAEVVRLRTGVCNTYDSQHDPARFGKTVRQFLAEHGEGRVLAVNIEKHTVDLWATAADVGVQHV